MGTVTLPVWVFAIVAALALWAVLDRLVIPVKIADLARRPLCHGSGISLGTIGNFDELAGRRSIPGEFRC